MYSWKYGYGNTEHRCGSGGKGPGSDPAPAGPQEESSPAPTEAPEVASTTSSPAAMDPASPTPVPELDPTQPPPTVPEVLSLSLSHAVPLDDQAWVSPPHPPDPDQVLDTPGFPFGVVILAADSKH